MLRRSVATRLVIAKGPSAPLSAASLASLSLAGALRTASTAPSAAFHTRATISSSSAAAMRRPAAAATAASGSSLYPHQYYYGATSSALQQHRFHGSSAAPAAGADAAEKKESTIVRWSKAGWEALRHLYHGFQLFWLNTKMAWVYTRRLQAGTPLTRRERLLLERATKDLMRLVPFSFFIIVPFAELLLPVALKIFPELIPSTFETEAQGKNKAFSKVNATRVARKRLVEYMAMQVLHYDQANKISDVLRRASSGDPVRFEHIKIVAPMCNKSGPLSVHNIPYDVLQSLAQVCGVYQSYYALLPASIGAPRLREAVLGHFRKLRKDDQALRDEGLALLTSDELVKANFARGMRWTETDEALMSQLDMWLRAAGEADVPYSTLFWVKPTEHSLHRTMMKLPVEARRKLLGISNLPLSVRESLERVIENVHEDRDTESAETEATRREREVDADDLAEIVKARKADFKKAATADLMHSETAALIAKYLTDANIDALFTEIEGRKQTGPVTLSDLIEYLAPDIGQSSHEVSKVFDSLEMGKGSDRITRGAIGPFVSRLRAIEREVLKEKESSKVAKDEKKPSSASKDKAVPAAEEKKKAPAADSL